MMQFRLHIDIPLGGDEEQAIKDAEYYINFCFSDTDAKEKLVNNFKINQVNYRLGHDEDRQKSNYLNKTENGHVTNKKLRLVLSD
ncbi:MAG TPA: hypothetical protein DCX27_07700 [Balneola sp.]|nr:hypothetical protein [Balneola sp.]|tara:strand:- start:2790 stop:3044 length:255 start_codon:yes stop_codon:yes gene_type:complete